MKHMGKVVVTKVRAPTPSGLVDSGPVPGGQGRNKGTLGDPNVPLGKATVTVSCTHPCVHCGTALKED